MYYENRKRIQIMNYNNITRQISYRTYAPVTVFQSYCTCIQNIKKSRFFFFMYTFKQFFEFVYVIFGPGLDANFGYRDPGQLQWFNNASSCRQQDPVHLYYYLQQIDFSVCRGETKKKKNDKGVRPRVQEHTPKVLLLYYRRCRRQGSRAITFLGFTIVYGIVQFRFFFFWRLESSGHLRYLRIVYKNRTFTETYGRSGISSALLVRIIRYGFFFSPNDFQTPLSFHTMCVILPEKISFPSNKRSFIRGVSVSEYKHLNSTRFRSESFFVYNDYPIVIRPIILSARNSRLVDTVRS